MIPHPPAGPAGHDSNAVDPLGESFLRGASDRYRGWDRVANAAHWASVAAGGALMLVAGFGFFEPAGMPAAVQRDMLAACSRAGDSIAAVTPNEAGCGGSGSPRASAAQASPIAAEVWIP